MSPTRIGVPFILVIGIGAWLKRKLNPDAARESKTLSERVPVLARLRLPRISARGVLAITLVAALWAAGIGVTIARFFFGLGYVTNMSDEFPWGIWIGFDVVSGIALAAGGFVIAGTVYVFNVERFHPIVRPAVLTALLGYLLAIIGLLFDLGRWYNIWRPILGFWNIHSPLLEVAWCVVLYTAVLALEFSPVIFEKLNLQWPLKVIRAITIPLVILGMVLSTLHQSSLGSLFLIFPEKINPLWYSPWLPVFFFISAIAVGLGMVMVESNLSARAFGRELENHLMRDLGRVAAVTLFIYFALKVYDLIARGATAYLTVPGFHSMMYWIEMGLGVIAPMLILATRRGRENPRAVFASAILIVGGVVLNRLNTALLGWWAYAGTGPIYVPSLGELTVTFTLVSAGVVAFGLAAKFLPVFPAGVKPEQVKADGAAYRPWVFALSGLTGALVILMIGTLFYIGFQSKVPEVPPAPTTSQPTTAQPTTAQPTTAAGSSKDVCLGCHGPFDKLVSATANYTTPGGEKASPHRYVLHDSKDIPECSFCHVPHPVPLTSTEGLPKPNVQWCYGCHHAGVLQCGTCH